MKWPVSLLFVFLVMVASPVVAHAQSSPAVMESRIDALERQLRLLQRRVSGGAPVATETADSGSPVTSSDRELLADLSARLGSLDRQIRQLNGRLEEFEYRQNEMATMLEQMRTQMAMQREQQLAATGSGVSPTTPPSVEQASPMADGGETLGDVPETPSEPEVALPEGSVAERFDYAFGFIRSNDLDSGRVAMEQFVAAHTEDAQVANAKFWLGRIHMQQGRNGEAAQLFLELIEEHPNNNKRVDALVDLADVLLRLGAAEDACNALAEFRRIENTASDRLKARARRTAETARCDVF